jgi:mitogen-activated protein kinase organizer 1
VFCVRFNQKGEFVMSGHADRIVRLWNAQKGTFISEFSGAHNREIFDLAIFADNAQFVTCGGDKLVYLWDVIKGHWVRKFDGHTQRVNCVQLSPY